MPSTTEKQKKFFGKGKGVKDTPKKAVKNTLPTEEDEERKGKIVLDGPKVKERKHFAPPTKAHKDKKKYDRTQEKKKTIEESSEEHLISCMLEFIFEKKYADANKYLKAVVDKKLSAKIDKQLSTPLFQ